MKSCNPKQSLALVALVAVVGGYVGASVSSAYVINDSWAPQSRRSEQYDYNLHRDVNTMLRLQQRRLSRLRADQESDLLRASAPVARDEFDQNARAYYAARRWCIFNGYTNPRRLSTCIQAMTSTGFFEGRQ